MSGIIQLDSNFKIPSFLELSQFENLKVHKHIYGQIVESNPESVYWLEYQLSTSSKNYISFARRLYLEYPEVAEYVLNYLKTLFPSIPFDIRRIALLKTKGNIGKHIDESFRMCSINIGIKNSSTAITRTYNTKDYLDQNPSFIDTICQDGCAYLLDTNSLHEVITLDESKERFLFTYGFGENFNKIYQYYKK